MFVALEGLEGVGKTTLGERLAAFLSATYLKSPPAEMNEPRGFIAARADRRCSFYFYLSSLYAMQPDIDGSLTAGSDLIVDRYLLSTIAYHDAGRGFETPSADLSGIQTPDLSVHVRCDPTLRESRLSARGFHIFERALNNEAAIDDYFSRTCDMEFVNDGPIERSVLDLARALSGRLGKDV